MPFGLKPKGQNFEAQKVGPKRTIYLGSWITYFMSLLVHVSTSSELVANLMKEETGFMFSIKFLVIAYFHSHTHTISFCIILVISM